MNNQTNQPTNQPTNKVSSPKINIVKVARENSKIAAQSVSNDYKSVAIAMRQDFTSLSQCCKYLREYLLTNQSEFVAKYDINVRDLIPKFFASIDNRFSEKNEKGSSIITFPRIRKVKLAKDLDLEPTGCKIATAAVSAFNNKGNVDAIFFDYLRRYDSTTKTAMFYKIEGRTSFTPNYLFDLLKIKKGVKKVAPVKYDTIVRCDNVDVINEFRAACLLSE